MKNLIGLMRKFCIVVFIGTVIVYELELVSVNIIFAAFLGVIAPLAVTLFGLERYASKQFREFEFATISPRAIPSALRKYVKKHTPTFEQLRFKHIDDFRLLSHPTPLFSRAFISAGGRCFGVIAGNHMFQMISFSSVFDDGTYLESVNLAKPDQSPRPSVPLVFEYVSTDSVVELFEHHCSKVQAMETERRTHVLVSTAGDYQDVARYAQRLTGWDLHQKGLIWSAPTDRPVGVLDDLQPSPPDAMRV